MKESVTTPTVATGLNATGDQAPSTSSTADTSAPLEAATVARVTLGEHAKTSVSLSDRERVRAFYRDVLGCQLTIKSEKMDIIHIGTSFHIGVVYEENALKEGEALNSIWLELRSEQPEKLKRRILGFGAKEIDHWDKAHFYFQAPGGQPYRIVGSREDLSKWQR